MYGTVDEIMLKFAANLNELPWANPKDVVEVDKPWEDPHWFDMERDQTIPDLRIDELPTEEKTEPSAEILVEETQPHEPGRDNLIVGKYGAMSLDEVIRQYENPEERELIERAAAGIRNLSTYLVDDRKRYIQNRLYDRLTSWVLDTIVNEDPLQFLKIPYKRSEIVTAFRPWSELALQKLKNEDPLSLIGAETVLKRNFVEPHYKEIWENALRAEEGGEAGRMFVDTDDFTSFQALGRRMWITDPEFFLNRVYPVLDDMINLRFRETDNMHIRKVLRIQKGELGKTKRKAELKLMQKRTYIDHSGLMRLAEVAGELDKKGEYSIANMIDQIVKGAVGPDLVHWPEDDETEMFEEEEHVSGRDEGAGSRVEHTLQEPRSTEFDVAQPRQEHTPEGLGMSDYTETSTVMEDKIDRLLRNPKVRALLKEKLQGL